MVKARQGSGFTASSHYKPGQAQKHNKEITTQIASYLSEQHAQIRFTSIFALGSRDDNSNTGIGGPAKEKRLGALK
jgi:hypothetical protein